MNVLNEMINYCEAVINEIEKIQIKNSKLEKENKDLMYWNKRYKEIINEQRALIIKLKDELNKEFLKELIKEEDNLL